MLQNAQIPTERGMCRVIKIQLSDAGTESQFNVAAFDSVANNGTGVKRFHSRFAISTDWLLPNCFKAHIPTDKRTSETNNKFSLSKADENIELIHLSQ